MLIHFVEVVFQADILSQILDLVLKGSFNVLQNLYSYSMVSVPETLKVFLKVLFSLPEEHILF